MDTFIYYSATRFRPLTPAEQEAIAAIIARYPVSALIAECGLAESDYDGGAFHVYQADENSEPWLVFWGATKLPPRPETVMRMGVRYWCRLLSEVQEVVPGASWEVHVAQDEEPTACQDNSRLLKAAILERSN
jgi:hypothetical protein